MVKFNIKVNGRWYIGEDLEKTYKTDIGSGGWCSLNHNELNVLKFSNKKIDAKEICGVRNIKSEIEKIFIRVQDGYLDLKKIQIVTIDD